ncbi:hypothetical protein V6N13_064118 [Hibiscus sabdariffa]|uniref:Uncharacterized protein n=1 Tax=Hibiscus sabdariffa TaxID=183260 RepID=A0ABR2R237_9ROSI
MYIHPLLSSPIPILYFPIPPTKQDPRSDISMALEIVLERQREINRHMTESLRADHAALQHKARERSMLTIKKQDMMAKQVEKESLVHDFMVFLKAIENDHVQVARNFNEKAMMNSILTMMNYDASS